MRKAPPWRVLVFPGGTEIGLEINRALRDCKEVELFSAGADAPSAATVRFKHNFVLPYVTDPSIVTALNEFITAHAIDFIFPAHDDVVLELSRRQPELLAKVVASPVEVCEIARSKDLTYKAVAGAVATPQVYPADAVTAWPVFVKPDRGQGSLRARRLDNRAALDEALRDESDLIISEYLPGEEYTVDCFSSAAGVIFARARTRTRTRAGISMQSTVVDLPEALAIARNIQERLPLRGGWFYQLKHAADGTLKLMEIGPRIAGTMAVNRAAGVNFPLLSLYDAAGYDVSINAPVYDIEINRALENNYRTNFAFSAAYIDLDDTLIVRGKVNTRLVRFVYQCINEGKPVYLITRHRQDVAATLATHRLTGLFDRIIHLDEIVCKSAHIPEKDAIFIDDSFAERRRVFEAIGIPTFDPSAVECLIDDRA